MSMNRLEIRRLRKKLGLSQTTFAVRLGVSIGSIHRWETGKGKPIALAMQALEKLAQEVNNNGK